MSDAKKKMEPWQLILVLIVLGAFYAGLYVMYTAIDARLESIEAAVAGKAETMKMALDRVGNKVEASAEAQAPAAAPAAPAAPAEEAPAEAEEKPAEEEPTAEKPAEEKPAE